MSTVIGEELVCMVFYEIQNEGAGFKTKYNSDIPKTNQLISFLYNETKPVMVLERSEFNHSEFGSYTKKCWQLPNGEMPVGNS